MREATKFSPFFGCTLFQLTVKIWNSKRNDGAVWQKSGTKVPFWQFFNLGKMALLNPCMEFKKNLAERLA